MIDNAQRPTCGTEWPIREVLVSGANTTGYVLIVEDDDGVSDVIATILADAGYEAACARSGEEALGLAQARQPGLILLDLSVAGVHLEKLIAAHRQIQTGRAPIVVMSGHPHGRERAAEIGADAFLEKPFDLLVLLDTVEAAFER
jgi:DNA-binding response OmpR family regulator